MAYAWGDESVRIQADPSAYLLAATIVDSAQPLNQLIDIKPKSAKKLHWREMTYSLQAKSLRVLSGMSFSTVLVAGRPLPRKKQERGRRKCLERLLVELEDIGVDVLVLEARDEGKDKKDIELLLSMRQKGLAENIRIVHQSAEEKPKLWISDQILGAYGDELCGKESSEKWHQSWEKIRTRVVIYDMTL